MESAQTVRSARRLGSRLHRDDAISLPHREAGAGKVKVIRTLAELEALRPVWDSIATPWPSPTQSYDWVRAAAEVFGADGDLRILVVGSPPSATIAPILQTRKHGQRELIGERRHREVTDFVYSDLSDIGSLARALAASKLALRVECIPADSPVPPALVRAYRGRGLVISRPTPGFPWIPLDPTWIDPERHLSSRARSNLRRSRRIAEGFGPVSCEILSPTPKELEPALAEAYGIEGSGWKRRQRSALTSDVLVGEFYRRYAAAACEQRILRVCFLRIGGRAAAMQLAVETANRFWLLKIGFSEDFARCSPGSLLMAETIRYAARADLQSYEFLGADEPWTRVWTPLVRRCVSLRVYPFSLHGGLALAGDVAALNRSEIKSFFRIRR